MRYLYDTNIISNLIRSPEERVGQRTAALAIGELGTSIIVAAELRFGYRNRGSRRLETLVEQVLADFEIAPWASPADMHYAEIRSALQKQGQLIGQMDMLIAAHALALDAVVVTDNEREFSRVPGLKVENWLR
ncbi:type II toxin-antitoxin system VapC family toxin [Agrobacterium rosae]|uniref:Ribonuclease VapC n=1 Tax=Agrobacterium rosae TaxID=1972867 RepID=A0A1R3TT60_9HYPH|nr:type II toxin-antitoxin system VapC family toxin [Agrobacterium rosae]SCX25660.1 tRNA(fMet)-specific endonuclease VapC [Agrobacterium rosae]